MQYEDQSKQLFQLTLETIDLKVDKAVSQANKEVVNLIMDLKKEMHQEIGGLRSEVHEIGNRLSSVETALGMRNEKNRELRNRLLDYAFKGWWAILSVGVAYLVAHNLFMIS